MIDFKAWLRKILNRPSKLSRRQRRQQRSVRLSVETLEGRVVPAAVTWVNDNWNLIVDNGDGVLSVGDTLNNANDTINSAGIVVTYGVNGFGTVASSSVFGIGGLPGSIAGSATINNAIANTNVGGTIHVLEGTFGELVNANKVVNLLGAQAGVDARTGRTGAAESVLRGNDLGGGIRSTSFNVTASDVVIDGFTVQDATSSTQFGFGISLGAGTAGSHVVNNIIQNNIVGISLANNSAIDQTVIQHNLIQNNNQTGPSSGTGIYTDQFNAGGTLANVLIDSNTFTGNGDAGIDFSSTDATKPATGIIISNNLFDANARGMLAFNLISSAIVSNTFQNSTSSATADIRLFEGVNGLTISRNVLRDGAGRALRISNLGTGSGNATNVSFQLNSITGYTGPAGTFQVDIGSYTGPLNAARNWWGNLTGPTAATNPGGAGQTVSDADGVVGFRPWLVYSPDTNAATNGVQFPTTVTITAGSDVSAAENDFTLLQNAVGSVLNGQTLDLTGDFDWTTANAAAAYAASTNTSATADIRGVELPDAVSNVTITSSAGDAHIRGRGDFQDLVVDSFLFADDSPTAVGATNFTVEKLNIDDFENAVMFGWNGGGTYTGTKIRDNAFTIGGDNFGLQNIAVYFAAGANQQITGNTVTFQGDGTRAVGSGARSFGFQNNTTGGTGYDGLLIDGNVFQLAASSTGVENVYGIWENGHNDDNNSHISITHNQFFGRTGIDLFDRALVLSSQTTSLLIDTNTFTDVDNVFYIDDFAGPSVGDHFSFSHNTLTRVGGVDGVFLRNVSTGLVHVGINWNINNTIDGFTGVRGLNELSTQGNGGSRTLTAATDLGAVNAIGTVTTAFVDDSWVGAGRFTDPDGIGAGVGPVAFAFNGFTTIQAGINAVAALGTVNVLAGTYAENLIVNKSVTLHGANTGIDPNTGVRGAETIVVPAVTETSVQGSTSGTIVRVGSGSGHVDVTIDGFAFDGHNASLTLGRTLNGVMVDTGAAIVNSIGSFDTNPGAYDTTMIVQNNIIKNLERYGVLVDNVASRPAVAGSNVSHNKIDNLPSGNNFGGGRGRGIAFEENVYGTVSFNVMTRVNVGWQDDNYNLASPSAGTLVDHNTITSYHRGIFHNLQYQNATAATISNNNLFVDTSGLGADANNFGLELISIESAVGVTVTNNNDTGSAYGVLITGDNTTAGITISGGTLSGNKYGVYVTDNDPQFPSDGNTPNAVISGVTITGATGAGIFVEAANGQTVGATLTGATTITGGPIGIKVSGATASLAFAGPTPASLAGQTGDYITLANGAQVGQVIGATAVSFAGTVGNSLTPAQASAVEDKITDALDNPTLGLVRIQSGHIFVTPTSTPTAADNDYTRLANALAVAVSGDEIDLQGTFDWTEPNAAASWAKGNDGLAITTNDNYELEVPAGLNNVTFTAPGGLGTATILGPGDVPTVNLEGVFVFDQGPNQNWTISNLQIENFDLSIGFFASGVHDFDGTTLTNNHIRIATDLNNVVAPADVNQNIGIHYSFGVNQTISNNLIDIPGDGVSDPSANLSSNRPAFSTTVGMQSNTSGGAVYDGLQITGNIIHVLNAQNPINPQRIIGFWENASAHSSNITVSNNQFLNDAPGNNPATNLQQAFWITSHSSLSTTVTYSGNTVQGANIGFKWLGDPEFPTDFTGNQAVRLWDNTITNTNTGVLIQSNGIANLYRNTITGSGAGGGVHVITGQLTAAGSVANAVQENSITGGSGDGIVIDATAGTIGAIFNNDLSGNVGLGVKNSAVPVVDASGNWWGNNTPAGVAAEVSAKVDYTPWLNLGTQDPTTGVAHGFQGDFSSLHVGAAGPQVASGGRINEAIGMLADGSHLDAARVINVEAGSYVESVLVYKSVQLLGAQAGVAAPGRALVPESTITPAALEPTALIYVTAPDVTIDGFTVDGAGSSVLLLDGSTLSDAARGIAVDGDNAQVLNNRVLNTYRRGVQFGIANSPIGGLVDQNDFNTIGANVATSANSGDAVLAFNDASITNNSITLARNGIYYSAVYAPNVTPIFVSGNNINVREIGIGLNEMSNSLPAITLTGNTVVTGDNGIGLLLWSIGTPNGLTTSANTFIGSGVDDIGVYGWVGTAGVPMDVTLTGGSISGYATGVLLSNEDTSFGVAPENAALTLDGVTINIPAGGIGVSVQDTAAGTKDVTATITNDTEIMGTTATTGVLVSGPLATAIITDNDASIHDNAVGISVDGGSALILNNHIYSNTTGVQVANGGVATLNGNVIDLNNIGILVTASAGSVLANGNNLAGNTTFALANQGTAPVDAGGNYWGSATPAGVAPQISGTALYAPWLTSGADLSGAPGFQPDYTTLVAFTDEDTVLQLSKLGTVGTPPTSPTTGHASITNGVGAFSYDPTSAFDSLPQGGTGSDSYTYTFTDANGQLHSAPLVTLTIAGLNDAPVLNDSVPMTLNGIDANDITNNGNTIEEILATGFGANPITDVDTGAVEGIAVYGVTVVGTGKWQFSANNGGTWTDFPAVTEPNALLLAADGATRVRFLPDLVTSGTPSINFVAWDRTDAGVNGGSTDVTSPNRGGITAYSVADAQATITVAVPNNDPPVNTVPTDTLIINEDNPLVFLGANQISVFDPDAGNANIQVTLTATNGTLTITSGSGLLTIGTGSGDATIRLVGSQSAINSALATLRFDPTPNFNGLATVLVATNDLGNSGTGGAKTDSDTINIAVLAVADAPDAQDDSAPTPEDVGVTIPVLSNDVDPDNLSGPANAGLTIIQINGTAATVGTPIVVANGTATLNAGGTITFTPAANFNGVTTFTYTISDNGTNTAGHVDTATVTVTVNAVNDAPTATNLNVAETYTEDTQLNLTDIVISDVDSPNVTATLTLSNIAAGSLSTGTSNAVTSTYNAGTGVWTASGAIADVNALLAGLTFNPALNFNSNFTIATSVSDGVAPAITGSKPMLGTAVDDAPTAINLSAAESYTEDTALNLVDIVVSDVDSANVTATLTLSNPAAGSLNTSTSGLVTSSYNAVTGVWTASGAIADVNTLLVGLTFTPAPNFNSNFTIATSVTDGVAAPITGSKAMTGTAVNDAPTATNLNAPETYTEDTTLNLIDIVISDVDSANVTATLTLSNVAAGSLNTGTSNAVTSTYVAGTGVWTASGAIADVNVLLAGLTFTPALNFNSNFSIATSVSDSVAPAVTGTKVMTGVAVNDAPTATNLSAAETYTEDTALNLIDIVISDVDSANVTATLTLSNVAAGSLNTGTSNAVTSTYVSGTGVWTASGAIADVNTLLAGLTFTPALNFNSNFSIATSVSDGAAPAITGSKAMFGTPVNDAPTATNLSAAESYTEDTPLNLIDIVVSDVDSANVTVTLTLSNVAAGSLNTGTSGAVTSTYVTGTGVWTASGAIADVNVLLAGLTFTPALNFNGNFTIATSVSDGVAPAITGSKAMTGVAVNDAPTATNLSAAEIYTEDTALNLIDIVISDVDSANVTATLTMSNPAAGSLNTGTSNAVTSTYVSGTGVWTASGAIADVNVLLAALTFTPALNFNSNFTIATSVSDGVAPAVTGSKAMTGTPVNDAPTATNMSAAETYTEDTALNLIDIVVSDVDSATVTATLTLSNIAAGSLNTGTSGAVTSTYVSGTGVWTASGAIANVNTLLAGLTFTPALNFNSNFTIATSVSDGVAPAITGSKAMTGVAVNDAPVNTVPGAQNTGTNTSLVFTGASQISVTDVDAGANSVQVTLAVNHGTLTLSGAAGLTFTFTDGNGVGQGDGVSDATMTFRGSVTNVNAALNGLTYQPVANYIGADSLTMTTNDLGNTGGGALTDTDAVNLNVSATFVDDFNRANAPTLGANWTTQAGTFGVSSNTAASDITQASLATVNSHSVTDVIVQADISISLTNGANADLIARYAGPGQQNYYQGMVTYSSGAYTAALYRNNNGVYTQLAIQNVTGFTGTGTLRFEVVGKELKLFVNNVLQAVAYDSTITTAGLVGVRGRNSSFDNFNASTVAAVNTTLTFSDLFNKANNSTLDRVWTERAGAFTIQNNRAADAANLAVGSSMATLNMTVAADVSVQADVTLNAAGSHADLLARYAGPDQKNYYQGMVANSNGVYQAAIYVNVNGAYTQLAIQNVTGFTGSGTLRFEVVGKQLKLFVNNVLQAVAYDTTITAPGSVGIRALASTLDNFNASIVPTPNTNLSYTDTFTKPNNSSLDRVWTERVGAYTIQNNRAADASNLVSSSLATLNTPAVGNVIVQAHVTLNAMGSHADLLARYSGPDQQNFYQAMIANVGGVYKVALYRNDNGVYTQLDLQDLTGFTGSGILRFEVVTNTLKLFVDGVQRAAATDNTFSSGLVGIRSANASFDDFNAS